MTISSLDSKSGPYNWDGSSAEFAYTFRIVEAIHLNVLYTDDDGVDHLLLLNDHYTVGGEGVDGGGNVSMIADASRLGKITILRNPPFTQETDLQNQGAFHAQSVEDRFDLLTMQSQALKEEVGRSVKIAASSSIAGVDPLIANVSRLVDSADSMDILAGVSGDVVIVAGISSDVSTTAGMALEVQSFAKIYLGPLSSDPANRNDASALVEGDLFFHSGIKQLKVYNGTTWVNSTDQALNITSGVFSGDGVSTTFTMSVVAALAVNVLVEVDGVIQQSSEYIVSGADLVFDVAPGVGANNIEARIFSTTAELMVPTNGSVGASQINGADKVAIRTLLDVPRNADIPADQSAAVGSLDFRLDLMEAVAKNRVQNLITAYTLYAASVERHLLPLDTTITTLQLNAKIHIHFRVFFERNHNGCFVLFRKHSDGSEIELASGDAAGVRNAGINPIFYENDNLSTAQFNTFEFTDTVGAVDDYLYKVIIRGDSSNVTALNGVIAGTNDPGYERGSSVCILQEHLV